MRILAVCNLFPPYVSGGNEIRFRQILEALSERHEVRVLTSLAPREAGALPEPWIHRELEQSVAYPKPLTHQRLYYARELWTGHHNHRVAKRHIEEFAPDVVYVSDTKRTFLGPAHAARERRVPVVWDITDTSLASYLRRSVIRRATPWTSLRGLSFRHAIAISRYIRDTLVERGVLDVRATYINQGVDLSVFQNSPPAEEDRPFGKLLFVGTLIPQKGLHVVLRGLDRLVRNQASDGKSGRTPSGLRAPGDSNHYRLTVCGDSGDTAYKEMIREFVRAQGLENNVDFLGRVHNSELPSLYRRHDAYVFSSIWPEPFATTPLEAMASGCPVIGTAVGGQRDFFRHDQNCLVYGAEDDRDLAEKVEMIAEPTRRRRIRDAALAEVHKDFSFPDYVRRVEVVLDRAVRTSALSSETRGRGPWSAAWNPGKATAKPLDHVLALFRSEPNPPKRQPEYDDVQNFQEGYLEE